MVSSSLVDASVDVDETVDDNKVLSVELSDGIVVGVNVVELESVVLAEEELVLGKVDVDITVDELVLVMSVVVVIAAVDKLLDDVDMELKVDDSVVVEDEVV